MLSPTNWVTALFELVSSPSIQSTWSSVCVSLSSARLIDLQVQHQPPFHRLFPHLLLHRRHQDCQKRKIFQLYCCHWKINICNFMSLYKTWCNPNGVTGWAATLTRIYDPVVLQISSGMVLPLTEVDAPLRSSVPSSGGLPIRLIRLKP